MPTPHQQSDTDNVLQQAVIDFGKRVRELRKGRGLTQKQLAEALSTWGRRYHQATIAKIEVGERPTAIDELIPLAAELGVTQQVLLGDTSPETKTEQRLWAIDDQIAELQSELAQLQSQQALVERQLDLAKERRWGLLGRDVHGDDPHEAAMDEWNSRI